jgi:hypothetical protein
LEEDIASIIRVKEEVKLETSGQQGKESAASFVLHAGYFHHITLHYALEIRTFHNR